MRDPIHIDADIQSLLQYVGEVNNRGCESTQETANRIRGRFPRVAAGLDALSCEYINARWSAPVGGFL